MDSRSTTERDRWFWAPRSSWLARFVSATTSAALAILTCILLLSALRYTAQPRTHDSLASPAHVAPEIDIHFRPFAQPAAEAGDLIASKQTGNLWTRRIKLVFTNTVAETLTQFPVLVILDGSRINYTQTQDLGQDLRFIDADGLTRLPHEIERWDESGQSYVWVRVPQIDGSSSSDHIWLYYGNPNAQDGQDPAAVWANNYRMVYHLDENPATTGGVFTESTANGFHGTNIGSTDIAGRIGHAQNFNGLTHWIDLGTDLAVLNAVPAATLSAWIRPSTVTGDGDIASVTRHNTTSQSRAAIARNDRRLGAYARSLDDDSDYHTRNTATSPINLNTWHYVVIVIDYAGDEIIFYVDGAWQPMGGAVVDFAASQTPDTNSSHGAIGSNESGEGAFFGGIIDEVRIASGTRSADWILAQHRTMTDNWIAYGLPEDTRQLAGTHTIGAPFTYTLTVSNTAPVTATQVTVTDLLGLDAHYISGGTLVNGDTVSWTIPTIPISGAAQVQFTISTCQESTLNASYRAVTSTEEMTSSLGHQLLTLLAPPALQAALTYTPTLISVFEPVAFTGHFTTTGSAGTSWDWDLGDGEPDSGPVITHTYENTGTFAVTLTVTDTCGYTATATKTVVVTGTEPDFTPTLRVLKQGPTTARIGETIVYTFLLGNASFQPSAFLPAGDGSPIHSILVTDSLAGPGVYVSGDQNSNGELDLGETWVYTAAHTVAPSDPDPLTNVVLVAGQDRNDDPVVGTDEHSLDIEHIPLIVVDKTGSPTTTLEGTIHYTFTVYHRAGSDGTPIQGIQIQDNRSAPPAYLSGDANHNDNLDFGEVWMYTAVYVVQSTDATPFVNVCAVEGVDLDGDWVSDTDSHSTTILGGNHILYLPVLFRDP